MENSLTAAEIRRRNLVYLLDKFKQEHPKSKDKDFAVKIKIDPGFLSQLKMTKQGKRNIGNVLARRIEARLGLWQGWLDTQQWGDNVADSNVEYMVPLASKPVPLISWVRAGDKDFVVDNLEPGDAEDWLPCPVPHSPHTYALQIRGESMAPEYQDGEIIFVDPEIQWEHNADVVVRFEDQHAATFKRLQVGEDDSLSLMAINPSWPDRFIPIDSEATCCGVVVFSGRYRRIKR